MVAGSEVAGDAGGCDGIAGGVDEEEMRAVAGVVGIPMTIEQMGRRLWL